ncbi:MAG: hypothetical protein ACM30I_15690 [Gemmatimonas sp.]
MREVPRSPDEFTLATLRGRLETESPHGRALLADLADNPVATVVLDREVPCVAIVWRGYATDLQSRYVHEMILLFIADHGVPKLLVDNTRLPSIGDDTRRWIADDWIPRVMDAGLRVIAGTEPSSVFASQPIRRIATGFNAPLTARYFADLAVARAWLKTAEA